ncbi:LYR motif-containing protein 9-like [Ostrea edulis]|uniref:LYR motif-containing protein 9-like n=1 Tax=Ostrea edulis TaxID=37623 RepID=UPI0020942FBC|nr:LYR motif-containing protein 9-like [Ostrea edulis]
MTPVQLYRFLLRNIRKLPKESQGHYKHYVRQNFNSHSDETDPVRIHQIIDKAQEDMAWLLEKELKRFLFSTKRSRRSKKRMPSMLDCKMFSILNEYKSIAVF